MERDQAPVRRRGDEAEGGGDGEARHDRAGRALAPVRGALAAVRAAGELLVPGVVATGAMWVLVPGQYAAAKAFALSLGVPPGAVGLLAPVALGALIWGVRWAVRAFRPIGDRQHAPTRETTNDPPS